MQVKLFTRNGSLGLFDDCGRTYARDITAYLSYPGNDFNVLTLPAAGEWSITSEDEQCAVAECENVKMTFTWRGDGALVRTEFKNNTPDRIENPGNFYSFACTLADVPQTAQCIRLTEENGNFINEMRSQIDTVRPVRGARYVSADFTVYDTAAAHGIFGYATYQRYFGAVELGGDGRIAAYQVLEEHPLEPGGAVLSDLLYISPCGDAATEALPEFASLVMELDGRRPTEMKTPVGFCTWYYYAGRISSDTLRENMTALEREHDRVPVEYIQIDDGWFDRWGVWEPKDNFDGDMKAMADEIKSRGFVPGIWVAPFGADRESDIFKEHPEYFVQMKCGLPWPTPAFDFSTEGACDYLRRLFCKLSHEWGFRYIKMDIISSRLAPGVYSDPEFTTVRNFRRALEIIRESVTEDTFLLACTAPLAPAAGLVDGMRVSCDVFERWESLRDVFNSVLKRYYTNGVYYINDADCLLVRTAAEEDGECWRLCTRTDAEIRTYVTAMAASGGALMLSDKMSLLRPEQYELISKLFPLNTRAAVPLDLMDSFIPGVLDFGVRHGARTVALINWGDAECEFTVSDSAGKLAFEFWSRRFCGLQVADIRETIEPHGCRVYFLTEPDAREVVVGEDASVVMDVDVTREGEGVTFVREKPGETVYVAVLRHGEWQVEER